ncbi:hypothetical protein NUW58_g2719 [Xylaria curta]|uniref:Uncharacterized protein n=1 Tax=Xylaria curta TaxID=42375 RepID=A0ACC1PFZ5_9PEZI|nr:hypothetical protein NUW58_g2719 [Xylaria curta]
MKKVHRPGPDPPAPRSRSDSFVRMLELEKMCKMKRIQQDHGSTSSTSIQPRACFPSVTTNSPTPRSRRASDYPPLSHQTQIMKAVRRSAALPSLSLSIAPSPPQAMTMRSGGSVEELSLEKEDRTKTVTFSEPEDEELSDDSSICQSPSWEQYGQKKKKKPKKPKKETDQNGTSDKEDTTLKRRSNRLIKSARLDVFTTKPLTLSDRSISAPNLTTSVVSSKMHSFPMTAEVQAASGKEKPKSKGFLSGFRLQHGNVAAVQRLMEARKAAEKRSGGDELLRSIQYESVSAQKPPTTRLGTDQNMSKSRKPPSIRSVLSTSEHSLSSQEKRSSGTRTSTGSAHGRSQSLLSSTLNKLRGPSYLYYQPAGEASATDPSKPANDLQNTDAVQGHLADMSNDSSEKIPGESNMALDHPQEPFDFAFPPKLKRMNTEPGPEIAPRARQPRSRKAEIQSHNLEQEIVISRPSGSRRVQIETPQVLTRDSVMVLVAAQERQSQLARAAQQTELGVVSSNQVSGATKGHRNGGIETDGMPADLRNQKGGVHRSRHPFATAVSTASAERLSEREGNSIPDSNRSDALEMNNKHVPEDDQISVNTYASTIRAVAQSHGSSLVESGKQINVSRTNGSEPPAHTKAPERLQVPVETIAKRSVEDLITFEKEMPATLQQPLQPHREDYFASFNDTYLPPVLDLRSPGGGKPLSPRLPFSGDSDEESDHDVGHNHFLNNHVQKAAIADRREQNMVYSVGLHPKEIGRASNEPKPKNSPATSTQYSDSDVPAFERLGVSSKAAKILAGAETTSASTTHSQHTDPSDPSQATLSDSVPRTENGASRKSLRDPLSERPEEVMPWRTRLNGGLDGDNWGEAKAGSLTASPSLDATPTSVSFADGLRDVNGDGEKELGGQSVRPSPPRVQSALDLHSATKLASHPLRPQRLSLKPSEMASSVSLPSSPPADLTEEVMPRKSALKMSRNNSTNGLESLSASSMSAAYLQEARKTAPVATASSSRALRPHFAQKNSTSSVRSALSAGNRAEPLAKMLVECCNCHFFHDMPSRVYECMAKPDSVVEDKSLGVSAAITTMVRCPWCAHGMTTQCCSGYAAVVYLKEKLHGK